MTYGANRVQDVSVTTGTGNFTLSGSPAATFQPLSAHGGAGATFGYAILGAAEWECGEGTIVSTNVFSRAPADGSAGAATLVNFSAGTKSVITGLTAAQMNALIGLLSPRVVTLNGAWAGTAHDLTNKDVLSFTTLSGTVANMSTGQSGTFSPFAALTVNLNSAGAVPITTWGSAYEAGASLSLPTATVGGQEMNCFFQRNTANTKWRLMGIG